MKRRNKILGLIFFTLMVVSYLGYVKNQTCAINDLVLQNIEALAEGESGRYICMGHGSVYCDQAYVEVKIDGYSLEE